ncbi:MAG TPA: flagellar basal body rod C-terminal domain-containing protein, partial [Ignavibacteriales bacterium]|nr:flagellar basal body rod C-terminal domain-containing protein [Ignavibacteriales bacterium]
SSLADIKVSKDDKGSYNISIGGVFGADAYSYNEFVLEEEGGELSMQTTDGFATARLNGGEMNALLESFNVTLPKYQQRVDDFVNGLVTSVNTIHATGNTLHATPLTGIDFFSGYSNGRLAINQNILDDENYIAVSADGTSGNGDIALSIYALAQDTTILGGKTFAGYYADLVSEIGAEQVSNSQSVDSSALSLEQIETQRADTSGVNRDEEMIDIMAFQKAYEASAKLLSIADEMLTTLLNMV